MSLDGMGKISLLGESMVVFALEDEQPLMACKSDVRWEFATPPVVSRPLASLSKCFPKIVKTNGSLRTSGTELTKKFSRREGMVGLDFGQQLLSGDCSRYALTWVGLTKLNGFKSCRLYTVSREDQKQGGNYEPGRPPGSKE